MQKQVKTITQQKYDAEMLNGDTAELSDKNIDLISRL